MGEDAEGLQGEGTFAAVLYEVIVKLFENREGTLFTALDMAEHSQLVAVGVNL